MAKDRIKVILLINELLLGGAQRMVFDIADKINKEDFDVHVVYMKSHKNFSRDRRFILDEVLKTGVRVTCLDGKTRSVFKESRALLKLLQKEKPDVLHTFMPYVGIIGRVIGRMAGVKSIVSLQANLPLAYTRKVYWADRFTLFLANVWTGAAIGIEEAYGGSSKAYSDKEWSKGRRHFTVVSGVDVDHIEYVIKRTDISNKRKEVGIQESKRIVSMTARLISWKGHDDLLKAFSCLPKDTELLLIGEGPRRNTLTKLAEELGISKRVHMVGDRNDVFELMAISDVYVQTYSKNENGEIWKGPNTSQMIAAASCVPAVSTNVPLIESFMTDGINGRLAGINDVEDLANKIKYLLEHKEDSQKLAQKAKKNVRKNYSLLAMVGAYEDIYKKLNSKQ